MELSFLGAAREVGRSAFLLDSGKSKLLLDYGMKMTKDGPLQQPLPIHGFLDGVIVSHAHLDHSGATPFLFQSSEPQVFMPEATLPVVEILLEDSLKIADLNGEETFSKAHMRRMLRETKTIPYKKGTTVTSDFSFELTDAGHILGASMVRLHTKEDYDVFYSGDFKGSETHLHKAAKLPRKGAEVLIMESTYGNRDHPDRFDLEKEFIQSLRDVMEKGGNVLCPAFAVGRSQELVSMLYNHGFEYPVYLDGMSRTVSEVYLEYPEEFRDYRELYEALRWVEWITRNGMRRKALKHPSVVVSTAGMLNGGPAIQYLTEMRGKSHSGVFFTGFQVPGTPGHTLLNKGVLELEELGSLSCRGMNIKYFDFSAHADRGELHRFVEAVDPSVVFCVHGDPEACDELRDWIESNIGCYAFAPSFGEKYKLEDYL
jgi:putative mRNA 3-end processing factor